MPELFLEPDLFKAMQNMVEYLVLVHIKEQHIKVQAGHPVTY